MKSKNNCKTHRGAPPQRTQRSRGGSPATHSSSSDTDIRASRRSRRHSRSSQKQPRQGRKARTDDDTATLRNGSPPAAASTRAAGQRSDNQQPSAPVPAPPLSGKSPIASGGTRSAHVDGDAAAGSPPTVDDSEATDGMLRPPLGRPHTNISVDEAKASLQLHHLTSAQVSTARNSHSLAPPPRRKYSRVAAEQSASSSASSCTQSSGSASGKGCRRKSPFNTKRHQLSLTERSSESERGRHRGRSDKAPARCAHAATSRHSVVSRSFRSNGAPQRLQRASAARRQSTLSESDASSYGDKDNDTTSTATTGTTDTRTGQSASLSGSARSSSDSRRNTNSDEDSREDSNNRGTDEDKHVSRSSSADDFLSSSSSAASPCALTDMLPRELYLHICSFLSEVDCCTLLEVSLRMHAAITCADSYVWRRLCMTTWQYKQGFQSFIQRVRALESLARREEREVLALQQHMLLLREQDTFFGESDVSATCDDATVLIRRRQHEQAQWMAAAAVSSTYKTNNGGSGGGAAAALAAAGIFTRTRRAIAVGSSTTSASSETRSYSTDGDDDGGSASVSGNRHASSRRLGRVGERRRSSKKGTHRSSTAAATASTSRRSARQSSRHKQCLPSSHRSRASTSRSASEPSQSRQQPRQLPSTDSSSGSSPSHRFSTGHSECRPRSASSAAASSASTKAAFAEEAAGNTADHVEVDAARGETYDNPLQFPMPARSADSTDGAVAADLCSENDSDAAAAAERVCDKEDKSRRKDRRVRIRLPEDADRDDSPHHYNALAERSEHAQPRSSGSGSPSSPASPHHQARGPREHRHRHRHHHDSHDHPQRPQGDTPKRQSTAPPPGSKHRRSHSVKRRKPAKQRRRRRGRSRRPRATGGGGGRHRSQHHRSQSRHHRSARQPHHHHHNPKASKSTRRRRRRQRNAAAVAAQAAAVHDESGERNRSGGGIGGSSSSNAALPAGGGVASHASAFFYRTPTYEAIKSTTPVLSVQHVAPVLVPFQLGGRPPTALQSAATTTSTSSPVVSTVARYPSRDSDVNMEHQANGLFAPHTPLNGHHTSSMNSGRVAPATTAPEPSEARTLHRSRDETSTAAQPSLTASHATTITSTGRGVEGTAGAATALSRPVPLPATAAVATATAPAASHSLAPLRHTPSANSNEEDGLYWWQLTPEARQQQLRRMQQREQRQQQQQQQQGTVAAGAAKGDGQSRAAPDGDEVADEAALREWDALEASFGTSSVAALDDEADEEDGSHDDDDDGSNRSSAETFSDARASSEAAQSDSSNSNSTGEEENVKRSHAASRRLRSRIRGHSSSYGGSLRERQRRGRGDASSTTSSRTHTSPPSSRQSSCTRSEDNDAVDRITNDENDGTSASGESCAGPGHAEETDGEDEDEDAMESGSSSSGGNNSRRARPKTPHTALMSSSSRLSAQAERHVAKALAKRYQAIEEAMIITRSKSVLIHTLKRQTYVHLPRLLAAAAAQRQRRMMMTSHIDPIRVPSPGTALSTVAAAAAAGGSAASPCSAEASSPAATYEPSTGNVPAGRPVLLLGIERSAVATPPAASAVSPSSTLPSSLSNAFPTSPGVALAIPASPLHQLARISSSTALADGVVLHSQAGLHTPPSAQQPSSVNGQAVAEAGNTPGVAGLPGQPLRTSADMPRNSSSSNVHDDDDDVAEDEEEPLAPVSWKFAYFMSRREARRATITLQDLLEGMWLVCFRSTGRTHPIRFTRQMRVLVYPPLKTSDEEECEEGVARSSGGGATLPPASTSLSAGSAVLASRSAAAGTHGLPHRLTEQPATAAAATAAAAPPLPFHILQSGAQLVVHQFPPMKVMRRSAFSTHGAAESAASRQVAATAAVASVGRCPAPPSTTTTAAAMAASTGVGAAAGGAPAPRTAATEAEQRFLAEPHATLRRLLLCMTAPTSASAQAKEPPRAGDGSVAAVHASDSEEERPRLCGDAQEAADVTQTSVRRSIAQHLGFAAAYVTDVLSSPSEKAAASATLLYRSGMGPLSQGGRADGDLPSSQEGNTVLAPRKSKDAKRQVVFFGPPTLQEFDAQQRREACFAAGGIADVQNDWGWTISGHHVKIFSLDVTAPLYVERLQRVVDVEVIGRSHAEARPARRAS